MKSGWWCGLAAALCLGWAASAVAEVQEEAIDYRDGDAALRGYFYWDDTIEGRRPGVLVVHEWWGLNEYAKKRARMLAELGYAAFALDMYGKGRTTRHGETAREWMQQITANVDQWRDRARLGLEILRQHRTTDPQRIAAIGYCFGGATVLELAYSGADIDGVVSFHGSLPAAGPDAVIKARILAAHGSADSFTPPERVIEFQKSLERAGADWHMVIHGGARHAFTNPEAGEFGLENLQYDADADRRSWAHMQLFFKELFE